MAFRSYPYRGVIPFPYFIPVPVGKVPDLKVINLIIQPVAFQILPKRVLDKGICRDVGQDPPLFFLESVETVVGQQGNHPFVIRIRLPGKVNINLYKFSQWN